MILEFAKTIKNNLTPFGNDDDLTITFRFQNIIDRPVDSSYNMFIVTQNLTFHSRKRIRANYIQGYVKTGRKVGK